MPKGIYKRTHPAWNRGRKTTHTFTCATCHKSFSTRKTKAKFCSRFCIRNNTQFRKGVAPLCGFLKGHNPWNKDKKEVIIKKCITCKKEFSFYLTGIGARSRETKFCSKKCIRSKTQFKKGFSTRLGIKHSEKTKIKLSKIIKKRIKEGKHNFVKGHKLGFVKGFTPWNKNKDFGGTEYTVNRIRSLTIYRLWKREIIKRDKRCIRCGTEKNLNVDHYPISLSKLVRKYNVKKPQESKQYKKFWDTNNGRVLCLLCHKLTPSYGRNFVQKV